MDIKDLEVNPKDFPEPHSGSFMRVLNVSVEAIENNLGPIYLWDDGKYSSSIHLKYKGEFFHEFVTKSRQNADDIIKKCEDNNILAGLKLSENEILWCVTEMNDKEQMDKLVKLLTEVK